MAKFIGKYEAKADAKGRVFIPSVYRKVLSATMRERIVVRKDADKDCLIFYPEEIWDKKIEALQASLDEWNSEDQMLLLRFVEDAEWLDIDAQGRVLLSKKNLQAMGVVDNEVLFVGMVDRFTVWGKKQYEETRLSSTDLGLRLREKMEKNNC